MIRATFLQRNPDAARPSDGRQTRRPGDAKRWGWPSAVTAVAYFEITFEGIAGCSTRNTSRSLIAVGRNRPYDRFGVGKIVGGDLDPVASPM